MRKSKFTEHQIIGILKQHEAGVKVDDVFKCLEARPSVLRAREIGERIVERMKEYVEVFLKGMVA
jgi:hypothetical protein